MSNGNLRDNCEGELKKAIKIACGKRHPYLYWEYKPLHKKNQVKISYYNLQKLRYHFELSDGN